MKWTEQQESAIKTQGSDILVSAAAGSGKTAVLTERIKQLVIDKGISVDNMLIVTFSNAAASEMKEKIIKSLKQAAEDEPERAVYLHTQIRHARMADISTFHKFSMGIIRRYFYLTDIDQNFGICDESRRQIMISESLDEMTEDLFDGKVQGSMEFTEFLRRYSDVRSEDEVKTMILEVHRFIMSMPDPFEWLDSAAQEAGADIEDFRKSPVYAAMRSETVKSVESAVKIYETVCDDIADLNSIALKGEADLENLKRAAEAAKNGTDSEIAAALDFKFETFRANKADKADFDTIKDYVTTKRDKVKKIIKSLKEEQTMISLEESVARINDTHGASVFLAELVKDFHNRFTAKKREKNLLDFNDIEHAALEILRHEEIAEEYRKHFEVIFIDEYQDSSILQETLIQQISRGNNVYMVGDVKQSIYKFRLAEPEIFIDKYNDFRDGKRQGIRIDLNRNFRSKGNIIRTVNAVFSNIMNRDTCGIEYDEDAELKKGGDYEGPLDRVTSLHLINTTLPEDISDIDDEILELKSAEIEAQIVAELVSSRTGTEIFDQKAGKIRKVTLNDIVILMRGVKGKADIYAAALKEAGIPAYIDAGEGYFETTEIQVFINLLRVIDNRRSDIPLLSVLYSPVFGFTTDELIEIRLADKNVPYHEAFFAMAADSDTNVKLSEKCRNVCSDLDRWRTYARFMPLETFLWHLMQETCYLDYVTALPDGDRRAANLRSLVDKAVDFSASGTKGLFAFLRYIEAMNEGKVRMGQSLQADTGEQTVKIMTIHKSKGLEFPIVVMAGLGRRFNRDRNTSHVIMHKELGMALQYVDADRHCYSKTLSQRIIGKQKERERMAEEMRILYVAMTRPMDELVMVGSMENLDEQLEKYAKGIRGGADGAACFLDWIVPYCEEGCIEIHKYDRQMLSSEKKEETEAVESLRNEIKSGFPSFTDKNGLAASLAERFEYKYPYASDVASKSKFAVSELNRMLKGMDLQTDKKGDVSEDYAVPKFMRDEADITPAMRGTLTHKVIELIPFEEGIDEDYIRNFVAGLPEKGYMTERESSVIDCGRIAAFFASETGRRACNAQWLRKEWPFTLRKRKEELAAMADSSEIGSAMSESLADTVLIQGIIDCCFRDEEGIVIVDYKTDRVDRRNRQASIERIKNEYRRQLMLYGEVVELALGEPVSSKILFLIDSGDMVEI